MQKKLLLLLIILCILGGLFWLDQSVHKKMAEPQHQQQEGDLQPNAEVPENGFQDLKITYFGADQQYRVETLMAETIQKVGGDTRFQELEAKLFQGEEMIQTFTAPEGWVFHKNGQVQFKGPLHLETEEYHLSMNEMWLNLDQGFFETKGQVVIQSEKMTVQAQQMRSDFNLTKIHLTGRPRMTVKKGG